MYINMLQLNSNLTIAHNFMLATQTWCLPCQAFKVQLTSSCLLSLGYTYSYVHINLLLYEVAIFTCML